MSVVTILAPAFYESWDKVRYLKQSADRWNVPITFYGFKEPYKGWHYIQIDRLIQEIEKVETEWVIYTDASDVIINGPGLVEDLWHEIIMSIELDRQVCAGGWMAKRNIAVNYLKSLRDSKPCIECSRDAMNPQVKWRCAIKWGMSVGLDVYREIFQVADEPLEVRDQKFYNPRTKAFPFVVHFAGGYTDPEVGKAALIEPYWKQLGYAS